MRRAWFVLLLAAFWLLLSGHYTALLLISGALSVGIVAWIAHRMAPDPTDEVGLRALRRTPHYLGWLSWQIARSSLAVIGQVWSPRLATRPAVGRTPVDGLSEIGTVAYANSITLTPGTLSMQVDDSGIEVHALRQSELDELRAGQMLRRLQRLEAG